MRLLALAVLAFSLLGPAPAFAQNPDTLDKAFRNTLRLATDSLLRDQKKYVETLVTHGHEYFLSCSWALRKRLDSTLSVAHDSLDVSRRNNARLFNRRQEQSMNLIGTPSRVMITGLLAQFEKDLQTFHAGSATCPTCKTAADYDSAEEAYRAAADSISGFYGDSMATIVEAWESSIDDAATENAEALDDTLQVLKEDYASYTKDHATRFEVDAGYESHTSYRGRDNGISAGSIGPTATYHHSSGLYLAGSLGWVTTSLSTPDVTSLGAGYEFSASTVFSGSIAYTHFWYSASSPRPQAVTNQEVSGALGLQTDPVNVEGTLLDDFTAGGGSEISIDLGVSAGIVVSDNVFGGTLEVSPTAEATWGQQSERLLQKRILRSKKKEIVRVSGSPYDVFSIMSYGLALPVELAVGNWSIAPVVEWTLPVDVLNQRTVLVKDPSSSSAFISAGLTVSVTFY